MLFFHVNSAAWGLGAPALSNLGVLNRLSSKHSQTPVCIQNHLEPSSEFLIQQFMCGTL